MTIWKKVPSPRFYLLVKRYNKYPLKDLKVQTRICLKFSILFSSDIRFPSEICAVKLSKSYISIILKIQTYECPSFEIRNLFKINHVFRVHMMVQANLRHLKTTFETSQFFFFIKHAIKLLLFELGSSFSRLKFYQNTV